MLDISFKGGTIYLKTESKSNLFVLLIEHIFGKLVRLPHKKCRKSKIFNQTNFFEKVSERKNL